MELILLEKVKNLGNLGDTVQVKSGFGRNFLIPEGKAVFATEENLKHFEQQREVLKEKEAKTLAKAQQRAAKLADITVVIPAQASDEGRLYGSIGVNEIKDALAAQSISVVKREIVLGEGPMHMIGDYEIELHLHTDVIVPLKLQIVIAK